MENWFFKEHFQGAIVCTVVIGWEATYKHVRICLRLQAVASTFGKYQKILQGLFDWCRIKHRMIGLSGINC